MDIVNVILNQLRETSVIMGIIALVGLLLQKHGEPAHQGQRRRDRRERRAGPPHHRRDAREHVMSFL